MWADIFSYDMVTFLHFRKTKNEMNDTNLRLCDTQLCHSINDNNHLGTNYVIQWSLNICLMHPHPQYSMVKTLTTPKHNTLFNFMIRGDVTFGRLSISGELT